MVHNARANVPPDSQEGTWETRTEIKDRHTAKSSVGWGARTRTNSQYAPPTDTAAARTRGPRKTGHQKQKNRLEPPRTHSPQVKTKRGDATAPVCSTAWRTTTDPTVFTNRNWNRLIRTRTTHRARRRGRTEWRKRTARTHSHRHTHTRACTNE